MPQAAQRPCPEPGCPLLTRGGRCETHQREQSNRPWKRSTEKTAARGYDRTWQKVRKMYITEHPMCEICHDGPSQMVHHKQRIEDRPDLRLDFNNLLAVCGEVCHRRAEMGRS